MSLTVFLLLSAVLAVAVGVLASLLLRSLMKDQRHLEVNTNTVHASDPCKACPCTGACPTATQDPQWANDKSLKDQGTVP